MVSPRHPSPTLRADTEAQPSAGFTPGPWKCAGCGIETPDLIRRCGCPTQCLYRTGANGRTESALKYEHQAHANHPDLTPLEGSLSDLLARAREYVSDALEAYEHTDGRDLLNEIDAALTGAGA